MGAQQKTSAMVCKQCKKVFYGKKQQKYCSVECKRKADAFRRKSVTYQKVCPYCGMEFKTYNANVIYCSPTCASRKHADKIRGKYFCEYCGKPRYSDHPSRNRFCSRKCALKARSYGTLDAEVEVKEAREKIHESRKCLRCGKVFIPNGANHLYCSKDCGYQANLKMRRDLWAADYTPRTVVCAECGIQFTTKCGESRRVYCSDKCMNRATSHAYKEKRKIQMERAYREPVSLKRIFKRDLGICQICGLPVPTIHESDNAWSATRDHIIPLSKGGEHSMINCQLAHRMCNSVKADVIENFKIDWFQKMESDPGRWDEQFEVLKKQLSACGKSLPTPQGQSIS